MKINSFKFFLPFLMTMMVLNACTDEERGLNPSNPNVQISAIETDGWFHSDLVIRGQGLDIDCDNNIIMLTMDDTNYQVRITECTESAITVLLPYGIPVGFYGIRIDLNDEIYTEIDGTKISIEIKSRPVILSLSKTTIEDGETIQLEGAGLLNPTNISQNDPLVWIMGDGYTNTVSEITVDEGGRNATVIIDEGIPAGNYNFLLTTDEWSNRIPIIIQ